MADKTIGELPGIQAVYDDSLIPVEQQGEACKMTGKQFREFGEASARDYVNTAVQASKSADSSKNAASAFAGKAGEDASAAQEAREGAEKARDAIENMMVEATTLATGEPASVEKSLVNDVVKLLFGLPRGETGAKGDKGDTGNGIESIKKTDGSGGPGTADTYTITFTNGEEFHFQVYNGQDGSGAVLSVNGQTGDVELSADDIGGLSKVARSGSYNDLANKPAIPAAVAVKGSAESAYRTGNVNLTPENIGALPLTGGTLSDNLTINKTSDPSLSLINEGGGGDKLRFHWFGTATGKNSFGLYDTKNDAHLFTISQATGAANFLGGITTKSATINGAVSVNGAISTTGTVNINENGNAKLNVGNKLELRTDNEGGNIRLTAPDAYGTAWEIDAYNGNLRIYANKDGTVTTPLILNPTVAGSSFAGTAAKASALAAGKTIQTNLSSKTAVPFDGSANITPGITGILGFENGGTKADSPLNASNSLLFPYLGSAGTNIPNGANIDAYTTPGNYNVTGSSGASSLAGTAPTKSEGFKLIVMIGNGETRIMQFAFLSAGRIRYRYSTDGGSSWNAWDTLTTTTTSAGLSINGEEEPSFAEQIRADVDYLAAMTGVSL